MSVSLKNYTLKYLATALLLLIAGWAALFYAVILEELYDNTDDGLKNLKIQIIRKAYVDDEILKVREFDFKQFRIFRTDPARCSHKNTFRNELFYMEYDEEMEPYRVLETCFIGPDGQHLRLEIRTSTMEEDDFRENLMWALITLYVLLVITIVIINQIVLRKVWKPFYKTLNNLEKYEFGKGSKKKIRPTKIHEFQVLNQKIDAMIDRNEEAFRQQKQFIENASHELQTPLAIAINKLDLVIENNELTEDVAREISGAKLGLLRLSRLNKSLLMLSRIDNNQFPDRESVDLNSVIRTVIDEFSDMADYKELEIDIEQSGVFTASIHPDLAFVLVSNLISNAIKYCPAGGQISIKTSDAEIVVGNTSHAKPLDPNLIFNRFYKSDQDSSSTGLGLSIVKTIVDQLSNLIVKYHHTDGMHFFSLKHRNS
jgi:signal transduction histidine kinase